MNDQGAQMEANEKRWTSAAHQRTNMRGTKVQGRSAEQRSPGAERTPASLRDNGDVEERESFEHSNRAASVNSGRVVAVIHPRPGTERYQ